MECAICLSEIVEQGILACDHRFCHSCIKTWFETNNTCPICRTQNKVIRGSVNTLTCLNALNIKHVFITIKDAEVKRCSTCYHYGTLSQSINTCDKTIEDIYMCSLCNKKIVYDIERKTITGNYELL